MVLFYQIRSHFHKSIDLPVQTCKSCGNRGTLKMKIYQKYMWIFGPVFPSYKYAIIQCDSCKTKLTRNEWTKELNAIYEKEIQEIKTPFRLWRGAIVFSVVTIVFLTFQQLGYLEPAANLHQNEILNVSENKTAINNLKENDVLFISIIKDGKTDYSTLAKVIKIEIDKTTLLVYAEKFEANKTFSLKLSDIDVTKFKEELIVKTKSLRKGTLLYENPPEEKYKLQAFGYVNSIIKN